MDWWVVALISVIVSSVCSVVSIYFLAPLVIYQMMLTIAADSAKKYKESETAKLTQQMKQVISVLKLEDTKP